MFNLKTEPLLDHEIDKMEKLLDSYARDLMPTSDGAQVYAEEIHAWEDWANQYYV